MDKSVHEIAEIVRGEVVGDGSVRVTGLCGIKEAQPGDLAFIGDPRYRVYLGTTGASVVIVPRDTEAAACPLIRVDNPYLAFAAMLKVLEAEVLVHPRGIHPTAVIGEGVVLGKNVALDAHVCLADHSRIGDDAVLYAGVYVGRACVIGPNTVIYPNAVIRERVTIGARCIIHANASVGSDGFGFAPMNGIKAKIPQVGTVVIGDDVEIGSNSAVDRATAGHTIIGHGVKIDNLVQIGHNTRIGDHTTISGSSAVAGSAVIGSHVTVGGMSGINGHIEIGDHAVIAGRSGITQSVAPGRIVSGFPENDHAVTRRIYAAQPRLPEALRRLRQLEERLKELEQRLDGQTADHDS